MSIPMNLLSFLAFQLPTRFEPKNLKMEEMIKVISLSDSFGIFFSGATAILTIFIMLVYFKNKEKIYLHYGMFLFFMLIYGFFYIQGTTETINSIQAFMNPRNRSIEPVTILAFSFYTLFCIELLDLKTQDRKLYRNLKVWTQFNVGYSVLYFIFYDYIYDYRNTIYDGMRVIIFVSSFYHLMWIHLKIKSPVKNYFLYGSIAYFIGAILGATRFAVGSLPFPSFYKVTDSTYFELGVFFEILFFALALGDRMYLLHREKERTSKKLIEQLSINAEIKERENLLLQEKVREKVAEITATQLQLQEEEKNRIEAEYQRNLTKAEMLARRLQINPHFLFNSLNAIKYLIQSNDSKKAIKYLVVFSRFIRQILTSSQKNTIDLKEEFDILTNFLELEKNRFEQEFTYHFHVEDPALLKKIKVPPLMLQPFVENAIWHGLLVSKKSEKRVDISLVQTDGLFILSIDDNGIGRKTAKKETREKMHKSLGISLTEDRIKLFNETYSSQINYHIIDKKEEDGSSAGTRVEFIINHTNDLPFKVT